MHLLEQIQTHLYLNVNVGDVVIYFLFFLVVSINSVYIVMVRMPEIIQTALNGTWLALKDQFTPK